MPAPGSGRVLIAPDKFKGTLTAAEVAAAIAAGVTERFATADLCPIADGGEGTAEILLAALGGEWRAARASDPLGREIECRYALLAEGTAVVEVAEASGLWRLDPTELDAERASSRGTGALLAAARRDGAERILLACGGSATTDAGIGALEAFDPGEVELTCLCDTDAGFTAAAALYAPQKGAGEQEARELECRLLQIAADLPHDPSRLPFTGAAGGLAGGLWAHGARLTGGARHVLGAVGFDERLRRADALVTGEGRLDPTSFRAKAVGEVARRAWRAGVPCHAIVGGARLGEHPRRQLLASVREAGTEVLIAAAAATIPDPGDRDVTSRAGRLSTGR